MYIILNLDLSKNGSDIMTPKEFICRKNKSLTRVLYNIPDGMDFKERTGLDKSDMLTVVVEISVCNHIKVLLIYYILMKLFLIFISIIYIDNKSSK